MIVFAHKDTVVSLAKLVVTHQEGQEVKGHFFSHSDCILTSKGSEKVKKLFYV